MGTHERFKIKTIDDLLNKIKELNLDMGILADTSVLGSPLTIGNFKMPNRIAIQPMEGCDGDHEGAPSRLTFRRYKRFGGSGAGLCWFEATAIKQEARANPRQLMLTEENKNEFAKLLNEYEKEEEKYLETIDHPSFGKSLKILQITHSGRYSAPGYKNPLRMYWYDVLDEAYGRSREDGKVLTDEELDELPDLFAESARLAKEVGFDGVDIKSCHRYLLSESLSAFTRKDSKYGGKSYENRTRLIKNIIKKVKDKYMDNNFLVGLRVNIFDAIPYPYGWGVVKEQEKGIEPERFSNRSPVPKPDLTEPIRFLNELADMGIKLADLTIANPYFNPFVSRPYDVPAGDKSEPHEHPLEGVTRFINLETQVRENVPKEMKLIGTGYSWLRQYGGNVASYEVEQNHIDIVGWGRMAFANPNFPKQIIKNGMIEKNKTCIACSNCTELMRKHTVTGCLIRDKEVYMPYFKGEKEPDWV